MGKARADETWTGVEQAGRARQARTDEVWRGGAEMGEERQARKDMDGAWQGATRPGEARQGDVKKLWNPANADEVADARRSFDDLRSKGYLAFKVTSKNGEKGEQIAAFDPTAGAIIMVPPMQGG